MPFAFRVANGYFRIDKCDRLAYKARRFPAGLPTVPKQRGFFLTARLIAYRSSSRAIGQRSEA